MTAVTTTDPVLTRPPRWGRVRQVATRPASVLAAGVVLALLVLAALGADLLRPDTGGVALDEVLAPPSLAHPFGTDEIGRDVLALSLRAMRVSFAISLLAAVVALLIGVTVGVLAGTLGGWVDGALMRMVDFLGSQNHFLFAILLVVLFRPALGAAAAVCLSVALSHWLVLARIVRGELLSLLERPFVAAAAAGRPACGWWCGTSSRTSRRRSRWRWCCCCRTRSSTSPRCRSSGSACRRTRPRWAT